MRQEQICELKDDKSIMLWWWQEEEGAAVLGQVHPI